MFARASRYSGAQPQDCPQNSLAPERGRFPTSPHCACLGHKPLPSPHLEHGRLSPAAQRGQAVLSRAGCATCHPPGLFTDLHQYDVGTRAAFDKPADRFDTPTLVELWRTAPYLHDGSAATVRDVLTTRNPKDQHGKTSNLSPSDLNDLCAYLLSL